MTNFIDILQFLGSLFASISYIMILYYSIIYKKLDKTESIQ